MRPTDSTLSSRDRLVLAATRQVRARNIASVTARSICKEAQVTAPTLYHHFADMADLYRAVLEAIFDETLGEHPDEHADPLAVIEFVWRAQLRSAREEPGVIALLNQLVSSGRIPEVMKQTYARLEMAFEVIGRTRPLGTEPRLAAEIYSAAGFGIATMIAASAQDAPFPDEAESILREAVLARIFALDTAGFTGTTAKSPPIE